MNRTQRRAAMREEKRQVQQQPQERPIESRVGIAQDGKRVVLAFNAPIHNLMMAPGAAVEHAVMLINAARMIEPGISIDVQPKRLEPQP